MPASAAALVIAMTLRGVAAGDALEPRWKLGWADLARYACSDLANGSSRSSEMRDAGLFGYEIEGGRVHHPRLHDWRDLPLVLGFTLPPKPLEKGRKVAMEIKLDRGSDYAPLLARGFAKRSDDAASQWTLRFEFEPAPGSAQPWQSRVEGGSFEGTVAFDQERGLVTKLGYVLRLERPGRGRGGDAVVSELHEELSFERILAAGDHGLRESIDRSVEAGTKWLWENREKDGTWGVHDGGGGHASGKTALAVLALTKGTLDRSDPRLPLAIDWILGQERKHVYDVALSMLAIEAWHSPSDARASGKRDDPPIADAPEAHRAWMRASADWLASHCTDGWWAYPGGETDMSNTQFAVLGLHAASRFGVFVPDALLVDVVERYVTNQARCGEVEKFALVGSADASRTNAEISAQARGWTYFAKDDRYPYYSTVTAAGIASVSILDGLLRGRAKSGYTPMLAGAARESMRDGWGWLHEHWNVRRDAVGRWDTLALYTLMRASVLGDVALVGKHDWYDEGARWLVASQREDGGWRRTRHRSVDTAFALLFLKRATIRVATTSR